MSLTGFLLCNVQSDIRSKSWTVPHQHTNILCLSVLKCVLDKSLHCCRKPAESGRKKGVWFSPGLIRIINLIMKVLGQVGGGTGKCLVEASCDSHFITIHLCSSARLHATTSHSFNTPLLVWFSHMLATVSLVLRMNVRW